MVARIDGSVDTSNGSPLAVSGLDTPLIRTLLADTEREIAHLAALPESERFPQLALLALEREQIAAIAYSEDLVADRVRDLPISPVGRELISRVLKWTHRDEALHAQYLRGVLLRSLPEMSMARRLLPVISILSRQAVGSVSGWVSAVSHHHSTETWGLRRSVAGAAIALGRIAGRIPDGLEDELSYQGFRHFCLLNVALEETAVLSYERSMAMLREPEHIETFERILDDEIRHAKVFTVLAEAFDDRDQLVEGMTVEKLSERIGEISPWFLPAAARSAKQQAFGQGSAVHVERGDASSSRHEAVSRALESAGLRELVEANPGLVAVRCHFMLGYNREDMSTLVHPEVMEALAAKLREWGATDVAVVETPNVYDRFFANRSVREVAEYFGFDSPLYRIVDVSEDVRNVEFERGLVSTKVSATWADASLRIVVSKLRGDPSEVAHLSLASLCGLGERTDEYLYTDKLVDHRTAGLMIMDIAPPDFSIVDAWAPVADGPLGVMGGAQPSSIRRIYAGADALSVDSTVLADMGISNPSTSDIFKQADQWFGSLSRAVEVSGEPGSLESFRSPHDSLWFRFVSATAAPMYFHLSGRGSWFVPRLDTDAFPTIGEPRLATRVIRRVAQRVFRLHPPS